MSFQLGPDFLWASRSLGIFFYSFIRLPLHQTVVISISQGQVRKSYSKILEKKTILYRTACVKRTTLCNLLLQPTSWLNCECVWTTGVTSSSIYSDEWAFFKLWIQTVSSIKVSGCSVVGLQKRYFTVESSSTESWQSYDCYRATDVLESKETVLNWDFQFNMSVSTFTCTRDKQSWAPIKLVSVYMTRK